MVANPAMNRRHRVIFGQALPGLLEAARLGVGQPGLDVLSRRTGVVAGRQQIDVDRPLDALWADIAFLVRQVQRARHVDGRISHRASLYYRLVVRDRQPSRRDGLDLAVLGAAHRGRFREFDRSRRRQRSVSQAKLVQITVEHFGGK